MCSGHTHLTRHRESCSVQATLAIWESSWQTSLASAPYASGECAGSPAAEVCSKGVGCAAISCQGRHNTEGEGWHLPPHCLLEDQSGHLQPGWALGPTPRPSPEPMHLSLRKYFSRKLGSHFPKGLKHQIAQSEPLGFWGSSSFSYRSKAIWFKIPIKAAMLISYIGLYFLITVPKGNVERRREEKTIPRPSSVHLKKVWLKSTPYAFPWNTPSFGGHFWWTQNRITWKNY